MNIWIPDGMKDITVDRFAPRQRLLNALDEVISEKLDPAHHIDAVESKLFGIGAESYTVGSNEFYMGYATSRQTALCLDAGHFHPTEVISDKISAAMGDWHAQYEESAAARPAGTDRPAASAGSRRRLHRPSGAAGRAEVPAVAGHLGDVLSASRYAGRQPVAG